MKRKAIEVSLLFLLALQLAYAVVQPGYGSWYDLNRPNYYDPDTGLPYYWATNSGRWVLIPHPVGTTRNPLFLGGANAYYRRAPNEDPVSRLQLSRTETEGGAKRSMLANPPRSLKYYIINRGGP